MEPFLGEIRMFTWNWAPKGWMLCNGALLPIQQYSALFALLGTTYGGNGQTNFALPDLRGRLPMHRSTDGAYLQGQMSGVEQVTIIQSTMAMHNHLLLGTTTAGDKKGARSTLAASPTATNYYYSPPSGMTPLNPQSIGPAGNGTPHANMQPFLVLNYCIAAVGIFPSRN